MSTPDLWDPLDHQDHLMHGPPPDRRLEMTGSGRLAGGPPPPTTTPPTTVNAGSLSMNLSRPAPRTALAHSSTQHQDTTIGIAHKSRTRRHSARRAGAQQPCRDGGTIMAVIYHLPSVNQYQSKRFLLDVVQQANASFELWSTLLNCISRHFQTKSRRANQ